MAPGFLPAYINDDALSVTEKSVLDWGSIGRRLSITRSSDGDGEVEFTRGMQRQNNTAPKISRYDPTAMTRITGDITDLVDDDSYDIDDSDAVLDSSGRSNSSRIRRSLSTGDIENAEKMRKERLWRRRRMSDIMCRQVLVITALVLVIIASSLAILYAVGGNTKVQTSYSISSQEEGHEQQQHLLEMAERVITACDDNKLNEDMSECQSLCQTRMCCFDESEDGYGCQDDTSKDCAVYAGCETLVMGVVVDGVEEDEA